MRPPLLSLTPQGLAEQLEGVGRAKAVFELLRQGADPFAEDALSQGARTRLCAKTRPSEAKVLAEHVTTDRVRKLLLGLEDGLAIEMVLIPEEKRTTLCISSQVGCARGCGFCMTATMGLSRNLRVEELLHQVHLGIFFQRKNGLPPLRNLVFMGMGEPLDNPDAMETALNVLVNGQGFGFAKKHITVSTVAPSPARVSRAARWPCRLAWSLHCADDQKRAGLIRSHRSPVRALKTAFADALAPRRPLFVEITLIADLNDSVQDAAATAALLSDFPTEVRINLLPMNPIDGPMRPSADVRVKRYQEHLRQAGFFCIQRRARGQEQRAACGQLAVLKAGT